MDKTSFSLPGAASYKVSRESSRYDRNETLLTVKGNHSAFYNSGEIDELENS